MLKQLLSTADDESNISKDYILKAKIEIKTLTKRQCLYIYFHFLQVLVKNNLLDDLLDRAILNIQINWIDMNAHEYKKHFNRWFKKKIINILEVI
jgi:hypothetical protein